MKYRRILTIQDISCAGQCSMTVALPVLSACGQETCILPSALLSTHTGGFGKPVVRHLVDTMAETVAHWKQNNIRFDAILVGYLGSLEAIARINEILDTMLEPDGKVIIDPAMADHGKLYSGLDETYAKAMEGLCRRADVVLPNITEACMMAGMPYGDCSDQKAVRELLENLNIPNVLLTGVSLTERDTGFALYSSGRTSFYAHPRVDRSYHGTGDLFAAAFTGAWMFGKPMLRAAEIAAEFTRKSIENTYNNPAHWYGVKFETAIPYLIDLLYK